MDYITMDKIENCVSDKKCSICETNILILYKCKTCKNQF